MNRKTVHQQASSLRSLALCFAALLLSGGGVIASSAQVSSTVAARFLEQSSWGPTAATIAQVQKGTLSAYLQQQFSAPVSTYATPGEGAGLSFVQNQFFVNAIGGPDQLR